MAAKRGYQCRIVYETRAVACEETAPSIRDEFHRLEKEVTNARSAKELDAIKPQLVLTGAAFVPSKPEVKDKKK